MKKIVCLVVTLFLLFPLGAWAEETPSFAIDAQHVYPGMDMSYAQGYVPTIVNNTVEVVMPLTLVGGASCDSITASLDLGESAGSPFVFKNYANAISWQRYQLESGHPSCFLVRFVLELSPDRMNGSYPLLVNVEGITKGGVKVAEQFPLYVVIGDGESPDNASSDSQPKLMVASYECCPYPLRAGQEGTLTVTIKNTNTSQSARNIKLSFQDEGGEILPRDTASVFIPAIGKGESTAFSLDVRATERAAVGPHTVSITMEYEDENVAPVTAVDTIVMDIEQPIRLEYEQPALPGKVTEGDNLAFSMNLMNLGKSTVYNVLVTFEIPGLNNGGSVLVGNIQPGEAAPAATNLRVSSIDGRYGETSGTIILAYENEAGEVFKRNIDVHTVIEEKIDVIPTTGEESDADSPVLPWWAYAIAGAVLLGIAGMVTAKMLKARKQREEDELRL